MKKEDTQQNPSARILLVDDEPKICAALAGALVSEGFKVLFVDSGDEALRASQDYPFDLVLLDLRMPGQGGWQTLGLLTRARPLLPVIIITALPGQEAKAKAAGVGALLEKPLDLPILLETMRRLLSESTDVRLARIAGRSFPLDAAMPMDHRELHEVGAR